MSYADSRGIPYTILAGDEEARNDLVTVKVMSTGEQIKMTKDEMLSFFKAELIT
jgi:histidyl-tRNA synthetase